MCVLSSSTGSLGNIQAGTASGSTLFSIQPNNDCLQVNCRWTRAMTTGKFVRCLAQTNELNEIELKTHKITKRTGRYAIEAGIMKAGYSCIPSTEKTRLASRPFIYSGYAQPMATFLSAGNKQQSKHCFSHSFILEEGWNWSSQSKTGPSPDSYARRPCCTMVVLSGFCML